MLPEEEHNTFLWAVIQATQLSLVGKVLLHLLNQLGLLACARLTDRLQEILQRCHRDLSPYIIARINCQFPCSLNLTTYDQENLIVQASSRYFVQLIVVVFLLHFLLQCYTTRWTRPRPLGCRHRRLVRRYLLSN